VLKKQTVSVHNLFNYKVYICINERLTIHKLMDGKNGFAERFKILAGYTDQKGNFVKLSK